MIPQEEISVMNVFLSWLYEMEYIKEPLYEVIQSVKQSKVVLPKYILTKRERLKIFNGSIGRSIRGRGRDNSLKGLLFMDIYG